MEYTPHIATSIPIMVPSPAEAQPAGNPAGPDIGRFVEGLKRYFWIVMLLVCFSSLVGYMFYKRQDPLYEGASVIEFGVNNGLLKTSGMEDRSFQDEKGVNTLVQAAKSRDVLARVAKELSMDKRTDATGAHDAGSNEALEASIRQLQAMVKVTLRPNTRFIDITARSGDPEQAASVASQMALGLVAELAEQKSKALETGIQSLVTEGETLREKLKKSELAMQDYKATNQAISLDERKDLVVAKLKDLGEQLNAAAKERLTLETQMQACQQKRASRDEMLGFPIIANHPKVAAILNQLGAKKAALSVLAERYKPKHPKYKDAAAEIENLEGQLDGILRDAVALIQSNYDNARDVEQKLQSQLHQQESEALSLEKLAIQYNVLRREMQSDQAVYESVLSRIKEVGVSQSQSLESAQIRVSQLATVPGAPVSPNPAIIIGGSAGGGLFSGLGIIFLLVLQDRSVRSVEDARVRLHTPVLGVVESLRLPDDGRSRPGRAVTQTAAVESILSQHKLVAEQVRELRTIVSLLGKKGDAKKILVGSAIPKEGKTFVATHLAVSFASQGLMTLIIDLDLRKPQIEGVFGMSSAKNIGVTNVLLGEMELREAGVYSGIPNLYLLCAGRRVQNPTELLASAGVEGLLETALRLGFQRIIIDSAPLIPVSDTLVFGSSADVTLMVVRCNSTPTVLTEEAIRKLTETGSGVSGLVLNRLSRRARGYSYHHYKAYHDSSAEDDASQGRG